MMLVLKLILIHFDLVFSLFLLRCLVLSFLFLGFILALLLLALLHFGTHAFLLSMILIKLVVFFKSYVSLGLDVVVQSLDDLNLLKDRHGETAHIKHLFHFHIALLPILDVVLEGFLSQFVEIGV